MSLLIHADRAPLPGLPAASLPPSATPQGRLPETLEPQPLQSARIVLPGGAGLVGQNLVAQLKRLGCNNLLVIDKHRGNLAILRSLHPDIDTVHADLAEAGAWQAAFAGAEVVVMLQAQIGGKDYLPFQRNNMNATTQVLATMKTHGVNYLVHISSSVVESEANDWYTQTKKAQEALVVASGIPQVVLRPTLMFGWFDRKHLGWLSRFMQKVPLFPIPGNGRYLRQPLFAEDFCRVIVRCMERRMGGQFNITGCEKVDYIDIIRSIKSAVRARALLVQIPYGLFQALLGVWAAFDPQPPFTTQQLAALVAHDEFELIDWPAIFGVPATPLRQALNMTYQHPVYSRVVLEF
jgi:nucleoside-diphosphate-sugar epimerase